MVILRLLLHNILRLSSCVLEIPRVQRCPNSLESRLARHPLTLIPYLSTVLASSNRQRQCQLPLSAGQIRSSSARAQNGLASAGDRITSRPALISFSYRLRLTAIAKWTTDSCWTKRQERNRYTALTYRLVAACWPLLVLDVVDCGTFEGVGETASCGGKEGTFEHHTGSMGEVTGNSF